MLDCKCILSLAFIAVSVTGDVYSVWAFTAATKFQQETRDAFKTSEKVDEQVDEQVDGPDTLHVVQAKGAQPLAQGAGSADTEAS